MVMVDYCCFILKLCGSYTMTALPYVWGEQPAKQATQP